MHTNDFKVTLAVTQLSLRYHEEGRKDTGENKNNDHHHFHFNGGLYE
jgi:hypothetical protein